MGRASRRRSALEALAGYDSGPDAPIRAEAAALERLDEARTVLLVEGISDQIALETLAIRTGRDLEAEAIVVVPMGGAHAIAHYVEMLGPSGADLRLTGLCDVAEATFFERALGVGEGETLSNRGFFECRKDLEDELLRAAGTDLESILESHGDLGSFRTLQKQSQWRDRAFEDQMHRWLRSSARRNLRYSRLIIESIPIESVPEPLTNALAAAIKR